jgi:hypothetical protein
MTMMMKKKNRMRIRRKRKRINKDRTMETLEMTTARMWTIRGAKISSPPPNA